MRSIVVPLELTVGLVRVVEGAETTITSFSFISPEDLPPGQ